MIIDLHHDILALNPFQVALELAPTLKGLRKRNSPCLADISPYCSSLNSNRSIPGEDTSKVYSP